MINQIIKIATEAGEIIKEGFGKNLEIEFKTDASNIVTNIDKAAEKVILDFVKKKYPNHSIIAEESGREEKTSEYTWVVDPLDGTTNFAHGLPIFSVSIGLQKNDEIVAGVIYDVMRDVVFSAELGSGCFANEKQISVNNNEDLAKSVLVTGFAYDKIDEYHEALKIFSEIIPKARGVRRLGSAAIDFCYVASGVFDGFWEANLSPWDVCAGILIAKEAGGTVTDFNGKPISIFSDNFLATNGKIHEKMISLVKS